MNQNLKQFLKSGEDSVFYPGHASAIARLDGSLFAFDPCWGSFELYGGDYWKFIPEQVDCDAVVPRLSGVIVSHLHEDHFCERVLRRVREARVPILIMGGRPDFEEKFRRASIPFQTAPANAWVPAFRKGIEVLFVPNESNAIDSSCFLRHHAMSGYCVYHGNDNFLASKQLAALAPIVGKVDVAMVPYAFINWYPWLMDGLSAEEQSVESERLRNQSLASAHELIAVLKPGVVIPFGNNIFYDDGWDHPLNAHLASPFDLRTNPVLTGDLVIGSGIAHNTRSWSDYMEDVRMQLGPGWRAPLSVPPLEYKDARFKLERIWEADPPSLDHNIIVNGFPLGSGEPRTEFSFDAPILRQWLHAEITFEQAVGTRRFRCRRVPNVYRPEVLQWCYRWL